MPPMPPPPAEPVNEYMAFVEKVQLNGVDVSGAGFMLRNITKGTETSVTSNESDSNVAIHITNAWDVGDAFKLTATHASGQVSTYHAIAAVDNGHHDFGILALGDLPADSSFNAQIERYGETCRLWGSTTGTDGLGNPTQTWDTDKGTFTGIVTRPTASDIAVSAGRLSDTDKKLMAPTTADIATGDRIEIDSITYDLLGDHADWQMKLSGTTQHQQLFLRRVL